MRKRVAEENNVEVGVNDKESGIQRFNYHVSAEVHFTDEVLA